MAATSPAKPIYLLADSQLLFCKDHGIPAAGVLAQLAGGNAAKAAYIGASNGDDPDFYQIFVAAMGVLGITHCRLISSSLPSEDATFLNEAALILLAGGNTEVGWRVIERSGMREIILSRYSAGAVLIGVSAGAVHLGRYAMAERSDSAAELLATLNLVPFVIDVHRPLDDWRQLENAVQLLESVRGLGIPAGGGVICHPDGSIEALRHAVSEFSLGEGKLGRSLLLPRARVSA